ncbi:mannosyltransferase, partial [Coemansia sp. 'formosensis']
EDDDGIASSIDTSGLASLLGGSSLASALEDPAQAQAILEYVKNLIRAKNQAHSASESRDIGRSPRMQYHALSLAKAGHSVDLVGYSGSTPMEGILASPSITIRHLRTPPQLPSSAPRALFYLFAPLKVVYQLVVLFWTILATIMRPDFILVQ